jgi:hypothetical protein
MKFLIIFILIIYSSYTLASQVETIENISMVELVSEEQKEINMDGVAKKVGARAKYDSGDRFTNFKAKANIYISNERKGIISINFYHRVDLNLGQYLFTLIETNSGMYQLYKNSEFKEPIGTLALFKDGFSVNFIETYKIFMGTAYYNLDEVDFFLRNQTINFKKKTLF